MHNRDTRYARQYHEATKHSPASVYGSRHVLDWENQPLPYKLYPDLAPLPLPQALPASGVPALQALSTPVDSQRPAPLPTLHDLAYVLFYSAGVTRRRHIPGYGEVCFRAAACTGALYHIELYLAVADLPALPAGVYHFNPIDFALRCLRQGDFRRLLFEASGCHPALQQAPVVILGTDTFWRNAWKYRARAYRHSFWDAGTILANLLAAATARQQPAQLLLGFVDATVNALLDLEARREATLFLVALGNGVPLPPHTPPLAPLHLRVAPLSRREVEYAAIHTAHAASALTTPEEVAAWRRPLPPAPAPTPAGPTVALPPPLSTEAPLEEVIRRRGSTRQFAPRALSLAQLATALEHASAPIAADVLAPPAAPLTTLYLIVHAVDGLAPGAYVYHPSQRCLEGLRQGNFRREAGRLALGQPLAAEASVDVFFLADLERVLAHFGNRGYRAAQLEAGLRGGRLYLVAYALGFGATGLTFFDDEVSAFFSPHAAGQSVMFLVALGYGARRRPA